MESGSVQLSSQAAHWLADTVKPDVLQRFLKALPGSEREIYQGFKPTAQNANRPIIRQRLAKTLLHNPTLVFELLHYRATAWCQCSLGLQCLEEDYLLFNWRQLAWATNPRLLAAALALDPRDRLKNRGLRILQRQQFWVAPAPHGEASIPLPTNLLRLFNLANQTGDDAPDPAQDKPKPSQAKQTAAQITQLQQARDKARDKARDAESRLKEASAEKDAELKALREKLKCLRQEHESLAQSLEQTVEERVMRFRREALGMDRDLSQLRENWCPAQGQDMLRQTERVLKEHRNLNEKYGTLSDVRQELYDLKAMLKRIEHCLDESVIVHPELHILREQLNNRCAELLSLPRLAAENLPELAGQILEEIGCVTADDDAQGKLTLLRDSLNLQPIRHALGPYWVRELRNCIHDKEQAVAGLLREKRLAALPSNGAASQDHLPREIWNLNQALQELGPTPSALLYIDGYNATKNVACLAQLEETLNLQASRDAFEKLCQRKASLFARFELVYDGTSPLTTRHRSKGIDIVFAAKKNDSQNADDYLAEQIQQRRDDPRPVWLVTQDYGLRARVKSYCNGFITAADFHSFLVSS
jgi:predicted RNA-binding protein with PIN domain